MAFKANIVIDQGSTFTTSIELTDANDEPVDLTGYTGTAQLRKHYTSSNAVSFGVAIGNSGIVALSLTANQTANIAAGRYVYDVEVTDVGGLVSRIVEGIVTITPQVTR